MGPREALFEALMLGDSVLEGRAPPVPTRTVLRGAMGVEVTGTTRTVLVVQCVVEPLPAGWALDDPADRALPPGVVVVDVTIGLVSVTVVGVAAHWVQTVTVVVQPSGMLAVVVG